MADWQWSERSISSKLLYLKKGGTVDSVFTEVFEQEGFRRIGSLSYRIQINIWWNPDSKVQVLELPLGSKALLKGSKAYFMQSITEQGETWAREIGPLQSYLEAHFPELHIKFSYFRDITDTLAATRIQRKIESQASSIEIPTTEQIAKLQRKLDGIRLEQQSSDNLLSLGSDNSGMLGSYMRSQTKAMRKEKQFLQEELTDEKEKLRLFNNLQKEYERNCSAACFLFSLCSNSHVITTPNEFRDALSSIVKEMADMHRYQVTQKLRGGRLNIHVVESDEPVMVWIEEWLGGGLSPRQISRLNGDFRLLREATEKHTMVTPNTDIRIDDAIKDDQKLLAARVVSTLVTRLDKSDATASLKDLTKDAMPANIGRIVKNGNITNDPFDLPLAKCNHTYLSGTTGSGKSYMGRVIVEEAARYEDLNILVLDPANQSAGLLVPEDRESILSLYPGFGMKPESARGFDFNYYAPAHSIGKSLPRDLSALGKGRVIVSFKGLNDNQRCGLFHNILNAVFEDHASEESTTLRLLIVVEEAQRFTKKRVAEDAKTAGQQAENALDRIVREGRKYGCYINIQSQSIKDFARDSASIRQNTNTKIFLHNSDREVDYAADFIGNGRQIIQLEPATAIIYNSIWGAVTVKVRPPLSKVWDFSAGNTQRLLASEETPLAVLSSDAKQLLVIVRQHYNENGSGLNMSNAGGLLGVTSKRQLQQWVNELERKGFVKTRKLRERGNPRIIELISSEGAD
ncbi:MAG: hypothetical protein DRP56_00780 [Planctomycetota bacterium]|nr:MAG: hypothetical protein DRP56_00780 [Planctomycetota bacterium]